MGEAIPIIRPTPTWRRRRSSSRRKLWRARGWRVTCRLAALWAQQMWQRVALKRTIGGNIADSRRVGKSRSGLPTQTPNRAVRSNYSFTTSLNSDKGKFHSDVSATRNVNMSECALNQNSLRLTLNHRVSGSSLGAPTKPFKNLAAVPDSANGGCECVPTYLCRSLTSLTRTLRSGGDPTACDGALGRLQR